MPGMGELLIILVIVLLIFGAGKLPAIGDALGRSIKNFKRSAAGDNEIEVSKTREVGAGGKVEALAAGDDDDEAEVVQKKKKRAAVADEE
ncbi:MAG TPA: twin-arginine translocase TatA/TatE family subunit [Kofleriaceae bacterium]|jgi:sec-independent protein translocase protein TatA|nr:twin-arginine translocase TatA/TatE family subunit [Kofleriaceae bacterium]